MLSELTEKERKALKTIARQWKRGELTAKELHRRVQEDLGDERIDDIGIDDIGKELDHQVSLIEKAWWEKALPINIIVVVSVAISALATILLLLLLLLCG